MDHAPCPGRRHRPARHRLAARISPAAARFRFARHREAEAGLLARLAPPAWCLINVPMSDASSTAIRATGGWS